MGEIATTLMKVQDRLVSLGWRQGGMGPSQGPNCLSGGIYFETAGRDDEMGQIEFNKELELERKTFAFLKEFIADYSTNGSRINPVLWNDAHSIKFDDVKWMLDEAIAEAKAQGV